MVILWDKIGVALLFGISSLIGFVWSLTKIKDRGPKKGIGYIAIAFLTGFLLMGVIRAIIDTTLVL